MVEPLDGLIVEDGVFFIVSGIIKAQRGDAGVVQAFVQESI